MLLGSIRSDLSGPIENDSLIVVRGGGTAVIGTPMGDVNRTPDSNTVMNEGVIEIQAGSLSFFGDLLNTGYIDVATSSNVFFKNATIIFGPPNGNTGWNMMRGGGQFTIAGDNSMATIIVAGGNTVVGTNVNITAPDGIRLTGMLEARQLLWTAGAILGGLVPETGEFNAPDEGGLFVGSGDQMQISGNVTLDRALIVVQGTLTWSPQELMQTISLANNAVIKIDGGQFVTNNVRGEILATDGTGCEILLVNNGIFNRQLTEVPGTITISAKFANLSGRAFFEASIILDAYLQTGDTSVTTFGSLGTYTVNMASSAGTVNFAGAIRGTYSQTGGASTFLQVGQTEDGLPFDVILTGGYMDQNGGRLGNVTLVGADYYGNGAISSLTATRSLIFLTGQLSLPGIVRLYDHTGVYLRGFNLGTPRVELDRDCWIEREGGQIVPGNVVYNN